MVAERIERRVGGGKDFEAEAFVESARQKFRRAQFFRDGVVIQVGCFAGEQLGEAEEILKGIVEPHAGGRAAKQIVVVGEDAPDASRIFRLGNADFQIFERDALTVQHAVDVMVRLDEECGRVGKRLVVRKPRGLRVPVRADDGKITNACIQLLCDAARSRVCRKKPINMHGTHFWPRRIRFDLMNTSVCTENERSDHQHTLSVHLCRGILREI